MKLFQKLLQIIICTTFVSNNALAGGISLIRDVETEDLLQKITSPLIKAANLKEDDIKIYIVNDSSVNAFVMAGQNIFINTGLIIKYADPNILSGVLAHEIGHIAAGHLARGQEEMAELNKITLLSYLAGIAAAALAGGDAGYAILTGTNQVAQRLAVKHTRTQEEAADKLALDYLKAANNSPLGLLKLLNDFNRDEAEYRNLIDEYALTHPVSQKRINYVKAHLKDFPTPKIDAETNLRMHFVVAKLRAFLQDSNRSLEYFNTNSSVDRYGLSVAYFKKGEIEKSLKELDILIKAQPKNGYFYELKGQVLFESGNIVESIKYYHQAIKLLPNPNLVKISLSGAILALKTNDKDLVNFAIKNLKEASETEKNNGQIFVEFAKAYEKIGEKGQSYLALAELNLLRKDYKKTKKYAKLALEKLGKNDKSNRMKAADILEIIKDDLKKDSEEDSDEDEKKFNLTKNFF
jgi:predicted Zn-dependent protease